MTRKFVARERIPRIKSDDTDGSHGKPRGMALSTLSRQESEEVRDDGCRKERRTCFRRDFNADVSTLCEYFRIEAGAAGQSARRGIRIAADVGYERAVAYVAGRDRAR